jgi:hypothetical protein
VSKVPQPLRAAPCGGALKFSLSAPQSGWAGLTCATLKIVRFSRDWDPTDQGAIHGAFTVLLVAGRPPPPNATEYNLIGGEQLATDGLTSDRRENRSCTVL